LGRIFFAHPKQGWDEARIREACAFLEQATNCEIIDGRGAFNLYFASCRKNWDRWAEKMGRGTELDGSPLFECIVVPDDRVARATALIVEHALAVQRPVLAWDTVGTKFYRVSTIVDDAPDDRFFGWRLITV
jgi:hypothetical protein